MAERNVYRLQVLVLMKSDVSFGWALWCVIGYGLAMTAILYVSTFYYDGTFHNPNDLTTQFIASKMDGENIEIAGVLFNQSESVIMQDISLTADGYNSDDRLVQSVSIPEYPALKYKGQIGYKLSIPADELVKIILVPRSKIGTGRMQTVLLGN